MPPATRVENTPNPIFSWQSTEINLQAFSEHIIQYSIWGKILILIFRSSGNASENP